VTHDRALLDAVSGRLIALENGKLYTYMGGWAEYRDRDEETEAAAPAKPAKAAKPAARPGKPKASPVELVERDIERAEARVTDLERQLAENWSDTKLLNEHTAARSELEKLLDRWETLFAEQEAAAS